MYGVAEPDGAYQGLNENNKNKKSMSDGGEGFLPLERIRAVM